MPSRRKTTSLVFCVSAASPLKPLHPRTRPWFHLIGYGIHNIPIRSRNCWLRLCSLCMVQPTYVHTPKSSKTSRLLLSVFQQVLHPDMKFHTQFTICEQSSFIPRYKASYPDTYLNGDKPTTAIQSCFPWSKTVSACKSAQPSSTFMYTIEIYGQIKPVFISSEKIGKGKPCKRKLFSGRNEWLPRIQSYDRELCTTPALKKFTTLRSSLHSAFFNQNVFFHLKHALAYYKQRQRLL
jgi:hypothetical protein